MKLDTRDAADLLKMNFDGDVTRGATIVEVLKNITGVITMLDNGFAESENEKIVSVFEAITTAGASVNAMVLQQAVVAISLVLLT